MGEIPESSDPTLLSYLISFSSSSGPTMLDPWRDNLMISHTKHFCPSILNILGSLAQPVDTRALPPSQADCSFSIFPATANAETRWAVSSQVTTWLVLGRVCVGLLGLTNSDYDSKCLCTGHCSNL